MVKSKQLKIMCPKMLLNQLHWCKNLSLHGFYYILRVTKDNIFGFNPLFSLVSWCRHGLSSVTYYQPGFSTTSPLYPSSKRMLSIVPSYNIIPPSWLYSCFWNKCNDLLSASHQVTNISTGWFSETLLMATHEKILYETQIYKFRDFYYIDLEQELK